MAYLKAEWQAVPSFVRRSGLRTNQQEQQTRVRKEAVARVRDYFDRLWSQALESFRKAIKPEREKEQ